MSRVSEIDIEIEDPNWSVTLPQVESLARSAASAALGNNLGNVVILLTDNANVADLNQKFRGRQGATNVLSFPAPDFDQEHLGDIALAFGVCDHEARIQGKLLADHMRHLVVHGVLHLLGHDHENEAEAQIMEAREVALLATIGVSDPYHTQIEEPVVKDGRQIG